MGPIIATLYQSSSTPSALQLQSEKSMMAHPNHAHMQHNSENIPDGNASTDNMQHVIKSHLSYR